MHKKNWCAVVALAGVLAAVQSAGALDKPLVVTEKDSDKTVSAKVGQEIDVVLQGNITTGYSWTAEPVNKVLEAKGKIAYKAPDKVLPGAPGVFIARYRAASAGTAHLQLNYRRPWEKQTAPARTFRVDVAVER